MLISHTSGEQRCKSVWKQSDNNELWESVLLHATPSSRRSLSQRCSPCPHHLSADLSRAFFLQLCNTHTRTHTITLTNHESLCQSQLKKQSAHLVQMAEVQSPEPAASVHDLCTAGGAAGMTARLRWSNTLLAANTSAFKTPPLRGKSENNKWTFFSCRVLKHTHHYLRSQNVKV